MGRTSRVLRLATSSLLALMGACRGSAPPSTQSSLDLRGSVVVEGAAPASDPRTAELTLWVDPDGTHVPLARATPSRDGSFRIPNVPDGTYWLDIKGPGIVEQVVQVTPVGGVGRSLRPLTLEKSRQLTGRVVDRSDEPVPLAHVLVFTGGGTEGRPLRRVGETRTSLDGQFTMKDLGRGPYRVLIEAPGLGAAEIPEATITSDAVRIRLDADTGRVSGLVVEAGRPAPGARIWVYGELLAEARRLDADGEGRFSLGGLGPGRYAVEARLGNRASRPALATVAEDQPGVAPVTLTMEPAEVQTGRVLNGEGKAAAGARLVVSEIRAGFFPLTYAFDADASGAFSTPALGAGSYRLTASAPGFVAARELRVEVLPGRRLMPATLALARAASVRGRITTSEGAPLAEVEVRLLRPGYDQLAILSRSLLPAAEAASQTPGRTFDVAARLVTTRTDREGRFVFHEIAPGPYRLEILARGFRAWRSPIATLGAGESGERGDIRLGPSAPSAKSTGGDATGPSSKDAGAS